MSSGKHAFVEKRSTERDARLLERLNEALAEPLEIPEPVTEIAIVGPGPGPNVSVEALELARQVYYFRHGTIPDAGVAIVEAGLADTDDPVQVADRLRHLFKREGWPKRSRKASMAIRDASAGGLYRSDRQCIGITTGNGAQPAGEPCGQSPLKDSDYCFNHDPRPEYVEKRRLQALHLVASRHRDLVPLKPFGEWADKRRRELLAEARARGERIHYNDRGWGRLARALGVDNSLLSRYASGKGNRDPEKDTIGASTVVRYLANVETTFEDVYGFPPPARDEYLICPGCGGSKSAGAKLCWECSRALGTKQCAYVNGKGVQCPQRTRHETGYCSHCRKIVFRVPKPKKPKPSWLTDTMVLYALDEYRRHPSFAWVAAALRAHDVDGICSVYKNLAALTGSLVKYFAKRRWKTKADIETPYKALLAKVGPVEWGEPVNDFEAPGILPPEPFNAYLVEFWNREPRPRGSFGLVAKELNIDVGDLSARIKGSGGRGARTVSRSTVEKVLARIDDGTTIGDLYTGAIA